MTKIFDMDDDLPDEMFEDMLYAAARMGRQIGKSALATMSLWNPSDEEVEEWVDSLKNWNANEMLPAVDTVNQEQEIRANRKRDGLCLECGDRGEFIARACFCRNGHGKIFG